MKGRLATQAYWFFFPASTFMRSSLRRHPVLQTTDCQANKDMFVVTPPPIATHKRAQPL